MSDETFRAAIVQRPPVLLDRDGSMQRVLDGLEEVAGSSARLAVFPETYLPGYPDYIWRLRPGDADDYELADKIHGRLVQNAVDLEADDLKPVREAARRHSMFVVIGVHERDPGFSRSTLFNTVVTSGADGEVLNRHRKRVPTGPERMVWGPGDGSGLRVLETPLGRLGGLICWENYMPLARFSLYAQGLQIWVAPTWDEGEGWLATMRHIALEGRCWVLGAGCSVQAKDTPRGLPGSRSSVSRSGAVAQLGRLGDRRSLGRGRGRAAARRARDSERRDRSEPDPGRSPYVRRCRALQPA